jgi:3-dehydroquinate synthetase
MRTSETTALGMDRELVFGEYAFGYHVRSGGGAWPELLECLAALDADRFVLITDDAFPVELGREAHEAISSIRACSLLTFPASEAAKTVSTVETLSTRAEEEGKITTASCIIALGGGLVANVAGFLAATQFRGLRLVHIPTTLLSMADVMPSLKQGVNTGAGKNHLGAYKAPEFVWNDLSYLRHLPPLEIRAALCEMIKFILSIPPLDPADYETAIAALRPDALYTDEQLLHFIRLCVDAKCSVMADDPHEAGEGLIFEYGHTVGHPIELLAARFGQRPITHGLAVGLGMLVAASVSHALGMLSEGEVAHHVELLQRNGAMTAIPAEISTPAILQMVAHDNKRGRLRPLPPGVFNLVLLKRLREPNRTRGTVLTQVEAGWLASAIDAWKSRREGA